MDLSILEAAWASRNPDGVTIGEASGLGLRRLGSVLNPLVQRASAPDATPDDLARLADLVDGARYWVMEDFLASGFSKKGDHARALRHSARSVAFAPDWMALAVSYATNTLACNLLRAGEPAEATRWAVRGLDYDPFYPMLLRTLGEVALAEDRERAARVYRYLAARGIHLDGFHGWRPERDGPSYEPSLSSMRPLPEAHVFRALAAVAHAPGLFAPVRSIAIALALAAGGQPLRAALAARMAAAQGGDAQHAAALEAAAQAAATEDQRAGFARTWGALADAARSGAVGRLGEAGDVAGVRGFLFDPSPAVRRDACGALSENDRLKDAIPYLEAMRAVEAESEDVEYPKPDRVKDLLERARAIKPPVTGAALVELVLARAARGEGDSLGGPDQPVPEDVRDGLELAPGFPIPPSIDRLLAHDGVWLKEQLSWYRSPKKPRFTPKPMFALVGKRLAKEFAPLFTKLPPALTSDLALPLNESDDVLTVLALGARDEAGEYAVLDLSINPPEITAGAPGFAEWLAEGVGVIVDLYRQYAEENAALASRWLGSPTGFSVLHGAPNGAAVPGGPQRTSSGITVPEGLAEVELGEELARAVRAKHFERIRATLDACKERFPDGDLWWRAATFEAIAARFSPALQPLLEAGADPNLREEGPPARQLPHEAARHPDAIALLRQLLRQGAMVDGRDAHGRTPLLVACEEENLPAVEALTERWPNANARDDDGWTPLLRVLSRWRGSAALRAARRLLECGADPRASRTEAGAEVTAVAYAERTDLALAALVREHLAR